MHRILALFISVSCIGHAAAVDETSGKKPPRTCRILFLAPPDDAPDKAFLHDGKSVREVTLPSMNLSDVYEIAAGDITLRILPRQPVAGEPLPSGAPAVALPEAIRDCYLIVAMDPDNKIMPLGMRIIDANPAGFKAGQMMWMNLSTHTVGGKLGKNTLNLKPQSRVIVDAPAGGFENYPVKLGYLPEEGRQAEPLCSTVWRHNPEARSVIFVMMSPNSRIPGIKSFSDHRVRADTASLRPPQASGVAPLLTSSGRKAPATKTAVTMNR